MEENKKLKKGASKMCKAEELFEKLISDTLFTGMDLEKELADFRKTLDKFQPSDSLYKDEPQEYPLEDIDGHVSDEKCFEMVAKVMLNEISFKMWLDRDIAETVIKKAMRFWTSKKTTL